MRLSPCMHSVDIDAEYCIAIMLLFCKCIVYKRGHYGWLPHAALFNTNLLYSINWSCVYKKATQVKVGGGRQQMKLHLYSLNCPHHCLISTNSVHYHHNLLLSPIMFHLSTLSIINLSNLNLSSANTHTSLQNGQCLLPLLFTFLTHLIFFPHSMSPSHLYASAITSNPLHPHFSLYIYYVYK